MIRGIHHVALNTANLERLVAFYRDVLGFTEVVRSGWADNALIDEIVGVQGSTAKQVILRAGNCHLEIFQYDRPAAREGGPLRACDRGYTHFCLDVTDIQQEYERLTRAGMKFHRAPVDFGEIKATYGRDPDGNIIELQETTDEQAFSMARLGTVHFT